MLRTPLSSRVTGRKLDFSTGDPTKDKLIMGGAVVVIIAAFAFMVWSLMGGDEKSYGERVIGDKVALVCVNPDCNYKDTRGREAYAQKIKDELTWEESRSMIPVRTKCPDCGKQSVIKGRICPECGELFATPQQLFNARRSMGLPAKAPPPDEAEDVICPECGTDLNKYWAEHGGKEE